MAMLTPNRKVTVNGKKLGRAAVDNMVGIAAENIILSGFSSSEELYKLIQINASNSEDVMIGILEYLLSTYTAGIRKESKDILYDTICANNVVTIGNKLSIVCDLLTGISSLHTSVIEEPVVEAIEDNMQEEDDESELEILDLNKDEDQPSIDSKIPRVRIPENWGYAN